jgi:hypothetical protein
LLDIRIAVVAVSEQSCSEFCVTAINFCRAEASIKLNEPVMRFVSWKCPSGTSPDVICQEWRASITNLARYVQCSFSVLDAASR